MATQTPELKYVDPKSIMIPAVKLRDVREDEKFEVLVQSIKNEGILNAIAVRRNDDYDPNCTDPSSKTRFEYVLGDGCHRLNAALKLGLETIPAQIITQKSNEIIQIIANMTQRPTTAMEYAEQFRLIMMMPEYEGMSYADLLSRLGMKESPAWLSGILKLNGLPENFQAKVKSGDISPSKAMVLAKSGFTEEECKPFFEAAVSKQISHEAFAIEVKTAQQAKRKALTGVEVPLIEKARNRKLTELKEVFMRLDKENAKRLPKAKVPKEHLSIYNGAFTDAIQWVLQIDPDTIAKIEQDKARTKEERAEIAARKAEALKLLGGAAENLTDDVLAKMRAMIEGANK